MSARIASVFFFLEDYIWWVSTGHGDGNNRKKKHYRETSKATGAIKPSESQHAKALWAMKAAKDRGEEHCDPASKEDILGRTKTRLELWEEHLKDPLVALEKALNCLENP